MRSARQIEHDKMIQGLNINSVLDRYFGKADTFVLISRFGKSNSCSSYEPYECKYPEGRVKLQKIYADSALAREEMPIKKYLKQEYEKISNEQKAELPPFDIICVEIKAECMEFNEKRKRGDYWLTDALCNEYGLDEELLEEDDPKYSLSIINLYKKGKVKYATDNEFIKSCYSCFGKLYADDFNRYEPLQTLIANICVRPLDYELRKPPFNELLPHLIKITPTFRWHCTNSGGLHKEFRFRFNAVTRAWLAEHFKFNELSGIYNTLQENDCFNYGLEDLAFYDGEKRLFSQCSHEGFQNDYLEQFDD